MAGGDVMLYSLGLCFLAVLIFALVLKSSTQSGTKTRPPPSPPALPIMGHLHLMRLGMPKAFQKLARLYGPLMQLRLGASTCVVVSNAQVASQVMKTHELNFSYRPQFGSSDYFQYKGSYFITAPYGPYWRFMKKLCVTQLLSSSQLGRFTHIREQEIEKLLRFLMLCSRKGRACDLCIHITTLTNNIMCRMAMTTTYPDKHNDAQQIHALVGEFMEVAAKLSMGEILGPLGRLDLFGYGKRLQKVVSKFDQVIERIMKEHEDSSHGNARDGNARDMMDILLQVYKDPNAQVRLTRNDLKNFLLEIFLAGTDTSSTLLQWAMAEIINHPRVLNNLRAEINSVVGSTRLVKESHVPKLPYLQAVVKEVLRLHPTAPIALRECAEGCNINGYDLKGHTRTLINLYAIMRDPEAWVNPDEFIPERFLVSTTEINGGDEYMMDRKGQDFTYIPFGRGRRGCPGEALALTVIHATVGALVQCLDWKIDGGDKVDMEEGSGFSAGLAKPLVVYPITRFNPF